MQEQIKKSIRANAALLTRLSQAALHQALSWGETKMPVERTEYKGNPLLVLKRNEEDKYPFSFGVGKARLILENVDEIKKFVAENEKPA